MTPSGLGAKDIPRLADRQMRRWEVQHPAPSAEALPSPCVALTRLPGSGGAEVARLVAERLDYGLFDREIVEEVARELRVDDWLVRGLDERVRSSVERFIADAMAKKVFTESRYLTGVVRVIATLGRRGKAVIVGRGAPFILPPERALRVHLVAPRDHRIERYAESSDLPRDAAARALDEEERRRSEFVRVQFHVDQDDPGLYDLVLNTGTLGYENAAALVVEALRRRFPA